ncbi:MAG: hypothetical protein HYX41_00460 [Bdellovibrio sp.]|nr:hypothetical protein [Bdellovibrio sp.]
MILLLLALVWPGLSVNAAPQELSCSFAREYITTLEYFRGHADFKVPEKNARELALQVSKGCTGAAQRFIKVTSRLTATGVPADASIQVGVRFATRSDWEAETFLTVFLKAYAQDYLDLTLNDSLKLATALTLEFQGDIENVRKDFEKTVRFCVQESEMALSRPTCAALATRIAKGGEAFSGGVADAFIEMTRFLESEKGPHLNRSEAVALAEKLLQGGKESSKNLVLAYRYAVSTQGLGLPIQDALRFSQDLVLQKQPQK